MYPRADCCLQDQSVINRTLLERQELLREAIRAAPAEGYPLGALHGF